MTNQKWTNFFSAPQLVGIVFKNSLVALWKLAHSWFRQWLRSIHPARYWAILAILGLPHHRTHNMMRTSAICAIVFALTVIVHGRDSSETNWMEDSASATEGVQVQAMAHKIKGMYERAKLLQAEVYETQGHKVPRESSSISTISLANVRVATRLAAQSKERQESTSQLLTWASPNGSVRSRIKANANFSEMEPSVSDCVDRRAAWTPLLQKPKGSSQPWELEDNCDVPFATSKSGSWWADDSTPSFVTKTQKEVSAPSINIFRVCLPDNDNNEWISEPCWLTLLGCLAWTSATRLEKYKSS